MLRSFGMEAIPEFCPVLLANGGREHGSLHHLQPTLHEPTTGVAWFAARIKFFEMLPTMVKTVITIYTHQQ